MKSLLEFHNIKKKASEVDFIVPFLDVDRPYFIDPSLMRFSAEARFKPWVDTLEIYIQLLNDYINADDHDGLRKVLDTGEAKVIGLGYSLESIDGSGVGPKIAESIIKILFTNPSFKKVGIQRLEQLQLFDKGIASDRISDLAAHTIKEHLINYTQAQCKKLKIPMEPVRVGKIFDYANHEWREKKYTLPINPLKDVKDAINPHPAVLLVPREIVRPLPVFLNYDSFVGYLRREKVINEKAKVSKELITIKAREDPRLTESYVKRRESLQKERLTRHDFKTGMPETADRMELMPIGQKYRDDFRDTTKEAIEHLFPSDLQLYDSEVSTALKSSRRDLIFQNIAGTGIMKDLKDNHKAHHLTVDAKNVKRLTSKDIKQVASYLNTKNGMAGIIVVPGEPTKANIDSVKDIYLHEDKVLLIISKAKLVNSLRGQSRVLADDMSPKKRFDPHGIISSAYSDIVTS